MNTKFFKNTSFGLIDQIFLSVIWFAVQFLIIRTGEKVEYGYFVQLFAIVELTKNIQNSVILSPLLTIAHKKKSSEKNRCVKSLFVNQTIISFFIVSLLYIAFLFLDFLIDGLPYNSYTIKFLLITVITVSLRDYLRNYYFLIQEVHRVILLDVIYGFSVLLGILILYLNNIVNVTNLFFIFSLSNLLSFSLACIYLNSKDLNSDIPTVKCCLKYFKESWALGRWALPSGFLAWANSSSYIYIASFIGGAAVAAELSAAKILLMPVGLIFRSWKKNYRSYAGELLNKNKSIKFLNLSNKSLFILTLSVIVYVSIILISYDLLQSFVLGEKYKGIYTYLMMWGAFYIVLSVRIVGNSNLLCLGDFKNSFIFNLKATILGSIIILTSTYMYGVNGTLLGVISVELIYSFYIWNYLIRNVFRGELLQKYLQQNDTI